uniref:Uncharacterized protein n=1 Tax=Rhizophora mucronata TaxID=61149 RepID=A0A2P2R000_RHIMU
MNIFQLGIQLNFIQCQDILYYYKPAIMTSKGQPHCSLENTIPNGLLIGSFLSQVTKHCRDC